jgi:putative endonuclease
MGKQAAVYILASQYNGTLYIGVTSNLIQRIWQHQNDLAEGFTKKYGVHLLVYYELHVQMLAAIQREKQLKGTLIKSFDRLRTNGNILITFVVRFYGSRQAFFVILSGSKVEW